MADPTPVLPEPTTETGSYRPLSGSAMASLVIAAFYALVVLTFAFISFVSGTPIFLPVWGLVVPVVAIVLAAVARRQIRTSEGSRSGLALANWGLRLGVAFGIVHAGIYLGTLLAVGMQAQAELKSNFFDKIRDGSVEDAFMFIVSPDQRSSRDEMQRRFLMMEGGKKGVFAKFKEHEMVRILEQAGPNSSAESMGIKSIDPNKDGYNVVQNYRITSPEGVYIFQFTLRTKDSKDSKKRRWQLVWKDTDTLIVNRDLTSLGVKMQIWKQMARAFATNWTTERSAGRLDLAFLDTCSPQVRDERGSQYQAAKMAATLASVGAAMTGGGPAQPWASLGLLADVNMSCELYMQGFHQFSSGDLMDKSEFQAASKKAQMLGEFRESFLRPNDLGFRPEADLGVIRRVEGDSPHLQAQFTIEIALRGEDGPKYTGTAELVVESDRIPESEAEPVLWRIAAIKLLAAAPPQSAGPPGMPPGGPGMMGSGMPGRPSLPDD